MANFILNINHKLHKKCHVTYEKIKKNLCLSDTIKKMLDRIEIFRSKKYFPVYAAFALAFVAILAWAGQAVTAGGGICGDTAAYAGRTGPDRKEMAGISHKPGLDTPVSRGWVNQSDIYLMARVIEGEAADEPFMGKVAVGAVIVNRMESEQFPKSVRHVVYQPLAFEAVNNGQYRRPLTGESIRAAEMALKGWDPTNGALYYWNPETAKSSWVWQRPIITKIGRHVFAR